MKICIIAHIEARESCAAALQKELEMLAGSSQTEEGCLVYRLHSSTENAGLFFMYEEWQSRDHLDRHEAAPSFRNFLAATRPLIRHIRIHSMNPVNF
ncbi:putative quinol monooxygenase [Oleidesulfovibrio alaskensis]|jgi:quinol monooxygenase YgiN|uniref:putative quinol monooxygenase n=1 Tax=Oleidesulfovibrio alaskensis TaxID=58180 RepID=UPI0004098738|nr:putative quinol monooxygenase [Oleidesulfovibrio alaskensis]